MRVFKRSIPKILSVAAALAMPAWSVADDAPDIFSQLDKNKDGVVGADEVDKEKAPLFERLLRTADKNSDGKLSREEFAAAVKTRESERGAEPDRGARPEGRQPEGRPDPKQIIERLDKNGDGKISKEEAQGPLQENFGRFDANSDGAVDADELRTAFERFGQRAPGGEGRRPAEGDRKPDGEGRRPAAEGDRKPDGERRPEVRRPEGGDREGRPMPPAGGFVPGGPLFFAIDSNRDGELSAEEIVNASANLAKLDKNGDGKITRDEIFAMLPGRPDGDHPGADRPAGDRPRGERPPEVRRDVERKEGDKPRDAADAPRRDAAAPKREEVRKDKPAEERKDK